MYTCGNIGRGRRSPARSLSTSSSSLLPLYLCFSRHGKQRGLGRGSVGDGVELGVVLAQRLGHLHLGAFEDTDELQGVDHGFALVMVVRDDEDIARPSRSTSRVRVRD